MKKKTNKKSAGPPIQNEIKKEGKTGKAGKTKITTSMVIGLLIGFAVIVIGFAYGIDTGKYVGYIVGFLGICFVGLIILISVSYRYS